MGLGSIFFLLEFVEVVVTVDGEVVTAIDGEVVTAVDVAVAAVVNVVCRGGCSGGFLFFFWVFGKEKY